MLVNYEDAKPGQLHWWEESWSDIPPEEIIENFNNTLRPHEKARKLIDYEILEDNENKPHSWKKKSLVTQIKGDISFDIYRCTECGVTGKRFGIAGQIVLDKKYKKRIYCK